MGCTNDKSALYYLPRQCLRDGAKALILLGPLDGNVEFTPLEDRIGRVVDFDKRNLDSNTGNCIMILTEPTTPLIFHAQPGGIFLFMGVCIVTQISWTNYFHKHD